AKGVNFILPDDVVVADKFAEDADTKTVSASAIPDGWMGLDIGPDSTETIKKVLSDAETILWNGPMGVFEMEKFATGTNAVAELLAKLTDAGATTIIGGGDSVAAVEKAGLANRMSHISTGGGASLELLEGKVLPGVAALDDAHIRRSDLAVIRDLHGHFFPVEYDESFYNCVARGHPSLLSWAAAVPTTPVPAAAFSAAGVRSPPTDQVVGFVIARTGPMAHVDPVDGNSLQGFESEDGAYILTLGVTEAWRRLGVGRHLMQRALADIQRRGCALTFLHVLWSNEAAQRFYHSLGFGVRARLVNYYSFRTPPAGEIAHHDAILMAKATAAAFGLDLGADAPRILATHPRRSPYLEAGTPWLPQRLWAGLALALNNLVQQAAQATAILAPAAWREGKMPRRPTQWLRWLFRSSRSSVLPR
ncbi:phosphoglycerate kinase, partial [Helicosporidium sp. ATCC 50920]